MILVTLMMAVALGTPIVSQTAAPSPVTVTKAASPQKALRFEVTIPASVDEVWAALTTHDGVVTWLWRDARVELRPGGDWIVLYPGGKTGGGTIISFEPKQRLTLAAMAPEQFPTVRERRTTAVFELEAASPSTTRVLLTQTGWQDGAEWDAAYDYLSRGNAILLEQLHRRFVSGPIDWSNMK